MDIVLLIAYLLVLAALTALLVRTVRRPSARRWVMLFTASAAASAGAYLLGRFYDARPGYGFMPGMTYFAEALFSYAAAYVYAALLLISAAACLVCTRRGKHNP